jgi:DNA uptake protein ComE-like DNA-binding protein
LSIVLVGLLLACIIHSFVIRKEYLIRLELLIDQKSEQYMTDEIRDKVAREYGINSNTLNADDVAMQQNTTSINDKKDVLNGEHIYDKEVTNKRYTENQESPVNREANNTMKTNQSDPSLLDINTCTQEDLLNLPGVGIIEVKKVLDFRNKNEFNSVEEFIEVVNMKPHFAEQIRPKLICNKVHNNTMQDNEKVGKENNKASHMGRMVDF